MKFLLSGPLVSANVLTWKGLQAHGVLEQELKDKAVIQGHLLKGQNWCSAAVCGSPPCVAFHQDKQGLCIHLACWELMAIVMFPATLAAQLYQNTNLVSQQLSKLSLPVVSSVMARETNVEHVSWFQLSPNSHVLCSCCLNQIQRLNKVRVTSTSIAFKSKVAEQSILGPVLQITV